VDFGLVAYPVKEPRLEIIQLRKQRLVIICDPKNPIALQKMVKLKTLTNQRFISFNPDQPTRKAIDKILQSYGVRVDHFKEFDNVETLKRAVEVYDGISIVPIGTVTQEIARKTLAAVEIADEEFLCPLAVMYKTNKVLSPAMKQFLTILKDTVTT
jgi:LysR family transcriptional regulator, transcriptional activator of the cysJI operon